MNNRVRTRFAPSPTGRLHIGSVQKILFSYAWAAKNNGDYILRLEDTDQKRLNEDAIQEIYDIHEILGIKISESHQHKGDYGPYVQSERLDLYKKYVNQLIESGWAYYAFETPQELAEMRKVQQSAGSRPRYNGHYRDYPLEEAKSRVEAGEKYVIRFKLPEDMVSVTSSCGIMGEITTKIIDLDDYVLMKSDGFPTYHLAVVVDDHLMEISHVFRGVEWLPTFPIHTLLYKALGWEMPEFYHIPNILDPNGGKLSKRSGSVAMMDFLEQGYLPEAIINFMILLGWNPKTDQEIFSLSEIIDNFDLGKLNKSNPVFNRQKLDWFNQQYLRSISGEELAKKTLDWVEDYHSDNEEISHSIDKLNAENKLAGAIELEQERITTLAELPEKLDLFTKFVNDPELDHKRLKKIEDTQKIEILRKYLEFLEGSSGDLASHDDWESGVRSIVSELEEKPGNVFMTIRIATTGRAVSPPLFEFSQLIGWAVTIERIKKSINILEN